MSCLTNFPGVQSVSKSSAKERPGADYAEGEEIEGTRSGNLQLVLPFPLIL